MSKTQEKCEFYKIGICVKGLFNYEPSKDDCLSCDQYKGSSRGLGDDVTKVIKKIGLDKLVSKKKKPCGCAKRRKALNKTFARKD